METISKYNVRLSRERRMYLIRDKAVRYDKPIGGLGPEDTVDIFETVFKMSEQPQELFCMLTLNAANEVTGAFEVTRGTLSQALVHPREIFQRAIFMGARSIIVAHNHPSGHTEPSKEDKEVTERLKESGELLGIPLLDHLIIADRKKWKSVI